MQAEQCFAVAHKMDRKSVGPVCVGAWHTPVYPLVEHSGSEFPARSTVPDHFRKVCALAAATLILPALMYAGQDNGKGNDGENNGRGNDKGERQIPVVPEANAAWVLIPFLGAVLLFSSRHLFRPKAHQNNGR
jgi:hypothetical protein